jgi:hypothetical protein
MKFFGSRSFLYNNDSGNNDCDGVWLLQGIDKIVVIMLQVSNE